MISQVHLKHRLANLVSGLLPDFSSGVVRGHLYRMAGLDVARDAFLMGNIELLVGSSIDFYDKLHIASGTVIGQHVTINIDAEVSIGKNVAVSPFVRIYTATHPLGPGSSRRLGSSMIAKPVVVEDGCWIGLGAMILPGVTIGHGSIVAAGAVVMESTPPDSYIEGNPAKVVRQLPWGDR